MAERARSPGELRRMIRRCEVAVARLEGSGAQALSFLKLLDEIKALMEYLEARGADLGPERTRMKTVEGLLRSKANVLVKEMKAVGGLARARQEVKPDQSRWWWYLDRTVAERRRQKMLRWLAIGGAVAALLVAGVVAYRTFLAPSPEEQMLQQHLMQATQLRQEGDLAGALAEYEAARALAPDEPEVHLWLGVLYEAEGRNEEAAAAFARARELIGDEVEFLVQRGMIYGQAGDAEAALADAKAALALDPESAMAHFLLGSAYEAQGDFPEALKEFERAAQLAQQAGNNELFVQARMRAAMLLQKAPALQQPLGKR